MGGEVYASDLLPPATLKPRPRVGYNTSTSLRNECVLRSFLGAVDLARRYAPSIEAGLAMIYLPEITQSEVLPRDG